MTSDEPAIVTRKKLIEVALPLDAINAASKREKSIRDGHPSTLHPWWARRPLAAARAVIFAQMVDDPSANEDLFPTTEEQDAERERLFDIIRKLVRWESTTDEIVLECAREEIWQSWRRACAENADLPRAKELFDRDVLPAFYDPFAGGGSLPLEAQRLGLEAHASDLNPVAVLINKAMIEIPPKFAGRPPVNPEAQGEERLMDETWRGAQGLAEDVRYYGRWVRDEAEKRIGHLYPKVRVTEEMAEGRPDLEDYVGRDLTVIAWLWTRTVKSPNPAFTDVDVPLASTFVLSKKKGKEVYVAPMIEGEGYHFTVHAGVPPESAEKGTKPSRGKFRCLLSDMPIALDYIKSEGRAGRLGTRLMAVVAEGDGRRVYLPPSERDETVALRAVPEDPPDTDLPAKALGFTVQAYGFIKWHHLFTDRQLVVLSTLSGLVEEACVRVRRDAAASGLPDDGVRLRDRGVGSAAYADAVALYIALAISKSANVGSSITTWMNDRGAFRETFARQVVTMTWDFAEANPFASTGGSLDTILRRSAAAIRTFPPSASGWASLADAADQATARAKVVSTDPPYYDNIGYADLADFFYVWLRRSLGSTLPDLFSTLATPKAGELVATPYRHGGQDEADSFFLEGMTRAMRRLADMAHPALPITIYYAFKQSENSSGIGASSTGWQTFLNALIQAGLAVTGTWPVRTEGAGRLRARASNALASSIVLVCRPRPADAPSATRREFQEALRREFPKALANLQRSNIAPVDLAQASLGPGMAVFTQYSEVLNADGSKMSVGDALALINATLDEGLAEQEGDLDDDSRWALTWFEQHGYEGGEYGIAEQLSKAKNTSVDGLVRAGVIESSRGAVRVLRPSELDPGWDPSTDSRLTVWETTQHLIRLLESGGEGAAGYLAAKLGGQAESARDLAYRLYVVSERNRRAADALAYNGLVQSWPEIMRLARQQPATTATQSALALDGS